jgi:4-hydroxy-tetrahydrodipicolinate synthase
MRLNETARGIFVISATPFADDGALDLESVDPLVEFYLQHGVHGLTILGLMGEAPKLTPDEAVSFVGRVLGRVAGRVPVVVGVSSPGLATLKALTSRAMDLGAAGVMIAPAHGLRGDEAVEGYFRLVCDAIGDVPVCLQDYPQETGVPLGVPLINRLIDAFPQIVVFKHEDCPGLVKLSRIRAGAREGHRRLGILVGNGGLYLPQELARGADGAMTGFAFPEMLVEVYERFVAGDAEGAEDVYDRYLPFLRYEQQPGFGLAVRKEVLRRRGALRSAAARLPAPRLGATEYAELDRLLTRLDRRLKDGS